MWTRIAAALGAASLLAVVLVALWSAPAEGPAPQSVAIPTRPGEAVYGPPLPAAPNPNGSLEAIPSPAFSELPDPGLEPLPPDREGVSAALVANPVYAFPPPALEGCPEASLPADEAAWRESVSRQWACLHAGWAPLLDGQGWPTAEPPVHFYSGAGADSDCGYVEGPAFYCGRGEGSVHFGSAHFAMAKGWDLAVREMVSHEYAHHLQRVSGITGAWAEDVVSARSSNVRRSELQSVCWSAMMAVRSDPEFDVAEYESWNLRLHTMQESEAHGDRAALVEWGLRGLHAATAGDCNTWAVPDERVS